MKITIKVISIIIVSLFILSDVSAQNVIELRKLTDKEWIEMTTDERLHSLQVSNNRARNQTLVGDFPRYTELFPRWGYDYYEMEERYENYAFRGFENFNIIEDRRNKWYYNQFGDRFTKMTRNALIWREIYKDDGSYDANLPRNYINAQLFQGQGVNDDYMVKDIDGVWVARESTDDWAVSIVGSGSLRTKLTPLTLNYPNLPGMKADFQSANYQVSIINSIIAGKGSPGEGVSEAKYSSLMLRGGQFRRKFGALTLGANYVSLYAVQTNRENGDTWKGTVRDYTPTPMLYAVRIVDDSPQDGGGPIIHDVKIKVDGVYRPDILPQIILDDLRNDLTTAVTNLNEKKYVNVPEYPSQISERWGGNAAPFTQTTLYERVPKYVDYLYMNDYIHGWNTKVVTERFDIELGKEYYKFIDPGGKPFQVNGNEYVVYLFDLSSITDKVKRVQAEITVANDYMIQVAEIFTHKTVGGHSKFGENFDHYRSSFWKTMAQADGNIKDSSNLRTVTVDFAWEVGNTIYGFDAHFNYLGFQIDGEYVTNIHYYMFADDAPGTGYPITKPEDLTSREGARSTIRDNAYYVIVQKDWKRFGFAGELFKMGKFYRPSMMYYSPTLGREYTFLYNSYKDFLRISTIADNDDDDQYPDVMPYSQGMSTARRYITVMDPDGVFPGNDLDHDGLPDNEKNDNNFPDYDEPFLMFDVDPDDFVFGDDNDNNNVPDFREDDMKYDTPYDLDRQGYHFNLRFTPQRNVDLFIGSYRTKGVGLDTRTYNDYLKVILNYDVFTVGNIYAEYRYERLQDNIQDSYVIVPTLVRPWSEGGTGSRYDRYFYYDEREYRNSKVNKVYLESKIRAIPSITLEGHIKYVRNSQVEGTMYDNIFQPKDILTTLAMVNKFVYTKQLGNWTFSPGVKFRFYKKGRSESVNPLDHFMMRIPVIYLKYQISPRTNITLGLQGIKGFELLYRDYIQNQNDYKQTNYTLEINNRTSYFGFDIWGGFGVKLEQIEFVEDYRDFEEYKSSTFFVQMWLGY